MQLIIAEYAGFCFGVKRAMEMVESLIKKGEKAYTLGPLIHNPQVVDNLKTKGITMANLDEIKDKSNLVIRTHGVGPSIISQANAMGLNVIDATCPFVKKVQEKAAELSGKGYMVIIIGDPRHPEVEGIKSWCQGDVKVIENVKDAENLFTSKKVGVLVQTTQTEENVENIMNVLKSKLNIEFFYDTRCNATRQRQMAAEDVAKQADIMLVIGGRNSANTQKLAKICQEAGARVYHIETAGEIKKEWFDSQDRVGITAGASTPDWIIKEVINKMEEINKEMGNMETESSGEGEISYERTFSEINEDTVIDGTVVKVSSNEVLVNVGYKSDGIIPLNELSSRPFENPEEVVKVGDHIKVYVLKLEDKEGNLILSKKKADAINAWSQIEESFEKNEAVEGIVTEVVKGGLLANVGGVIGFIPASHADLKYVPDLSVYTGKNLKLKVLEIDKNKNRVVLSHKLVLEEEKEKLKEQTWNTIQEGQVIKGVVKRLTDFGAFVDIGGVDGLIHISDLSWQKVKHPSDVIKEEQEVEVKVLKVDRERGRISLGLKQVVPNPWDNIEEKYKIGSVIEGKVVNLVSFGAFVEIEPGVEGLVHISQISKEHIPSPDAVLKAGDIVKVKIMDINAKDKKISLSIKEALDEKPVGKDVYKASNDSSITIGDILLDKKEKNDENKGV
ncbi:MAG TPA: bifunctional 4-hydroxy-3-methylbut-2-enyl diphosphate reductase/30S ribosomal protein S1 [Thermoanaerobacterales bacterium]|nr:bifunctional 4-hydroxy-3-methylbut-2-enyl diphosphate reductase/30S ribosomal protein S1 [Thermoanaerobacterales bacterium]